LISIKIFLPEIKLQGASEGKKQYIYEESPGKAKGYVLKLADNVRVVVKYKMSK